MTLIEKLEKLSDEYFNLYACHGNRADLNCTFAVDEAINIVKEYNEWINADDCLPDERVKVLAWHNRKEKFFIATYDRDLKIWLNDGKPYSSEFLYNITHWMLLPSLPSEVQE